MIIVLGNNIVGFAIDLRSSSLTDHLVLNILVMVQDSPRRHKRTYQALWNPGTMALLRTFQVSGSAGISPLPIMGSRISVITDEM